MTEEKQDVVQTGAGAPRWVGLAVAVLAGVSLVGLVSGWTASSLARRSEQNWTKELQTLRHEVGVSSRRLAQAEETNAQVLGELKVVTERLKLTQGEIARARQQSKQIREEYTKQISEIDAAVKQELASKASAEEVKALAGDVSGVRTDLNSTRDLFHQARGELGTLIARNHEEIEELRRTGQRDYFEFVLEKKGGRQKIGDITLELRGANAKKGQFTVALYADDMRLEKKNRSVNEPIYFYTRGYRAPLELVVNQVGKNRIAGYVSMPKAPATAATGN